MNALCEFLSWDSDFFGRRIARVIPNRLNQETAEAALVWCEAERIDCLYFLADLNDVETARTAEDHAFRLVDIRVLLDRSLRDIAAPPGLPGHIRLAAESDVPVLGAIARTAYRDSRFYYDPQFPAERCDTLYQTWIEKSCRGYADAVLVADVDGQPAGFISCHREHDGGKIGLVGVGPDAQGQGIGRRLVEASLIWFAQQGAANVTVVTQGRNIAAQRLYQRCGFATRSMHIWYHRWFTEES